MVLLGSKATGRNVEQHDFFFGIGHTLHELVPQMKAFWPEAADSLHIDGWREVTSVEGYQVSVLPKENQLHDNRHLFFINLGGYQSGKLEETHYTLLTVQSDRKSAIKTSTQTEFFKTNAIEKIKSASAHIDEKYGIDVDDIYRIEELLSETDKQHYHIHLSPGPYAVSDEIHLGYFKIPAGENSPDR